MYDKLLSAMVSTSQNSSSVEAAVKELESKKNVFDTRFNFPNVGKSGVLYIATDENKIYIWDETNHVYRCISSDSASCSEFDVIQIIL